MVSSHNNGPPPINYSTHPKRCQLASREAAPEPPSRSSHWFIYDQLPALPRRTLDGAASPITSAAPSPELVVHVDGRVNVTEAHLDDLIDALEGLSIGARHTAPLATPTASAYVPAPAPSPPPVTHALPVPFAHVTPGCKTQKKFYSVTVGKCCGVFSNWNFVTTLVSGVSGSSYIGFKSYEDAIENYYEAKDRGCVRVEREPGDEARFGPLSQAIM